MCASGTLPAFALVTVVKIGILLGGFCEGLVGFFVCGFVLFG